MKKIIGIILLVVIIVCLIIPQKEIATTVSIIVLLTILAWWLLKKFGVIDKIKNKLQKNKKKNDVIIINDYVNKMLINKELINHCSTVSQKNSLPLMFIFELSFVPYEYIKSNRRYELVYNPKNYNNSPYFDVINKYTNYNLNEQTLYTEVAYKCKNKDYNVFVKFNGEYYNSESLEEYINPYKDIELLYTTLKNKKIISEDDNIYQYQAFLFVLYLEKLKSYTQIGKNDLDNNNLSENMTDEKIIRTLYENDFTESDIGLALFAKRNLNNNYKVVYSHEMRSLKVLVDSEIKKIESEKRVNKLLSDDVDVESKLSIDDVDLMSGEQFEDFVVDLFKAMKYKTTHTKLSGDQGIDVIAENGNSKVAIQAKCYTGTVGNHAIMEAVAGAKHYGATKCMVVTNSTFTKSAKELAESNNVVLWDRKILKEKINQYM